MLLILIFYIFYVFIVVAEDEVSRIQAVMRKVIPEFLAGKGLTLHPKKHYL